MSSADAPLANRTAPYGPVTPVSASHRRRNQLSHQARAEDPETNSRDDSSSVDESSCQAKMTAFPLDPGSECCTHESANTSVEDYDFNHDGPDCVPVEGAGEVCTEGAISIEIETIIPHPNFDRLKKKHDIGLIRLKETAPYTDFIRPICLPTTNPEANPPDHSLYAVSWFKDNVKKVYEVPFVNQEKCKPIYSVRRHILSQDQLCAGGIEGMDTCKGDGGGPLVHENEEGLAELTGIVSFGPKPCGQRGVPSVYTNVFEYLDWIKTNIVA